MKEDKYLKKCNFCENYKIRCPYALSAIGRSASLPCIASQTECNAFRKYLGVSLIPQEKKKKESWNPSRR